MDKKIQFSVLLSIYAKESSRFLTESLNSIFDQTLLPNEVVIVKDGPLPYELEYVIDCFAEKYSIIKVVVLTVNSGLSKALNEGLKYCSFDIVARMDTDDICCNNRFEKQINYFENHPDIDIVGTYARKIDYDGKILDVLKVPLEHDEILKYIWTCPFVHPTVMFRKKKILSIGGYNPNSGPRQDDYELWFRCAKNGLHFSNIGEQLLYYRFSDDNVKKNNIRVGWWRLKVGLKGCSDLKCSVYAYLGVAIPLFRALLPYPLNVYFYHVTNRINPRSR